MRNQRELTLISITFFLFLISISFISSASTTFKIRTMPEYNHSIIFTINDPIKIETLKDFKTYSNFEKELSLTEDISSSKVDLYFSARSGSLVALTKRYYNQSVGGVINLDPFGLGESEKQAASQKSAAITANIIETTINNTLNNTTSKNESLSNQEQIQEKSFNLSKLNIIGKYLLLGAGYLLGFIVLIVIFLFAIKALRKLYFSYKGTLNKSDIILDNQGKVISSNMEGKIEEAERKIKEAQEVIEEIRHKKQKVLEAEQEFKLAKKELEEADKDF